MTGDTTEIELKLDVAPEHLDKVRRHSLVRSTRKGRAHTKALKSIYYDTPDFLLYDGGASLRVRHAGDRRIQNVKTRGDGGAGLFARREWETDIDGDTPDHDAILSTGLDEFFGRPGVLSDLRPLFSTEFKRTEYRLGNGTWEVAMTLDRGAVVSDGRSDPICEVELELVRGDAGHLFEIAEALHETTPLRLNTRSKSERGYALLGGAPRRPVKAPEAAVTADMPTAEAIRTICRACQRHLMENEWPLRQDRDPEAVHQMRVALRRLRSALSLFKDLVAHEDTEALKAELKWLTGELGPARDTDVFIAEVLGPVRDALPEEDGLEALTDRFRARNAGHYETALAAIDSRRFTALMLRIGRWIESGAWREPDDPAPAARLAEPVGGVAAAILESRHAKVIRRGRRFTRLDAESRHQLRVQIKKLRYAAEFFGDVWKKPKKTKVYIKALKALQEDLGDLNDIAVAHDLLHETVAESRKVREAWAAGMVAGWHTARHAAILDAAKADWKAFADTPPFWPTPARAAAKAEKATRKAVAAAS